MNQLELWRSRRKLNIQELADRCGINRATINRIEHGKVKPSAKTLGLLAEALNIDVTELIELTTVDSSAKTQAAYPPFSEIAHQEEIAAVKEAIRDNDKEPDYSEKELDERIAHLLAIKEARHFRK
ncbi:MAG: helix-turn-helix transcriptional regulator [Chloroflexota bacterium]